MKRNHIHLAQGIPGDGVISGSFIPWRSSFNSEPSLGMRSSSQVLIYIDVQKALDAGITFFLSENGVVLTEGDERGFLSPEYFLRVEDRQGGTIPGWPISSSQSQPTTIDAPS
jgi:2'-phosphotransferase